MSKPELDFDPNELTSLPSGTLEEEQAKRPKEKRGRNREETQAEKLMKIALARYRFGRDELGKSFAVPVEGSGVVRYFGKGTGDLGNELAREFYRQEGKPPAATALGEVRAVLAGLALEADPEPVALRVGRISGPSRDIVIDLGDAEERAIVVRPDGWEIVEKSPILFRRTKPMLPYPEPVKGGSFDALAELLNVGQKDLDLLIAYLVLSFVPEIDHAVLYLNGEQGTGKSETTKMLVMLMDPNAAPLRKRPRDETAWSVAANASWVVPLENMSRIPEWLSDLMCSAVTGEGVLERQLFTNDDVSVREYKRILVLNGIEIIGIRPDLADRMFMIKLDRIPDDEKRGKEERVQAFEAARGELFGAILDTLSAVLGIVETGKHITKTAPRLADFAHHLRAFDLAHGKETQTFRRFWSIQKGLKGEVSTEDIFAVALADLVSRMDIEDQTATQILQKIQDNTPFERGRQGIPSSPKTVGSALTRLSDGLRTAGWDISNRVLQGRTVWTIRAPIKED